MTEQQAASNDLFYVVGGTIPSDAPSYVVRQADAELYDRIQLGDFCYVLTTRQAGKSSLMIRTAERLRNDGTAVVTVDLTGIGTEQITADQWYYGIAETVHDALGLPGTWLRGGTSISAYPWCSVWSGSYVTWF